MQDQSLPARVISMTLAKGARPRAALLRLLPILIGAGLLAGCQSPTTEAEAALPVVRAADWRVIERSGEARYLAPGASTWAAALPASALPGGSRVATGDGGRLILTRAQDHVSAGPASRFSLPGDLPGATLQQTAGRLRYRLGEAPSFAVATPALAIEAQGSAFDVTVRDGANEVAVERGRLRVATPDGAREIELGAGQSAQAGTHGPLAFRSTDGEPWQPVERTIMPALQPPSAAQPVSALHPRPAFQPLPAMQPRPAIAGAPLGPQLTAAAAAANQASTSAAVSIESAVVVAATGPATGSTAGAPPSAARAAAPATIETDFATMGGATMGGATTGTAAAVPEPAVVDDDPLSAPAPDDPPATDELPEDPRLLYDRLTAGMVDALAVARAPRAAPAHARSI